MNEDLWYGTSGPRNADIVIVGEAWGREEDAAKRPFVGQSGKELDRMLLETGIHRPNCFVTNTVPARPDNNEMWRFFEVGAKNPNPALRGLHPTPIVLDGIQRLVAQLDAIRPKVVLATGNYALWALTNCTGHSTSAESEGRRVPNGIESWRGSMFYCDALPGELAKTKCIPLIHPAAIMRAWYNRAPTVHDLRVRVPMALRNDWRPNPAPVVLAPPTFKQAVERLEYWLYLASSRKVRLVCDIETAKTLITCIGFADSINFAMSIPLIALGPKTFESYWTPDEELQLVSLIRKVLLHPNILVEGQNFIYDTQYLISYWGCSPHFDFDTMLAHHLLFPGTPKGLDYLSSLYCKYHWYWKDDSKEWNTKGGLPQLLAYNALDCLRQFECGTELRRLIVELRQEAQWEEEKEKHFLALRMMLRGTLISQEARNNMALQLVVQSTELANWFKKIIPQEEVTPGVKDPTPWWDSTHQQRAFFSQEVGFSLPLHRKTKRITFGAEALDHLSKKHPEFIRLFKNLEDYRSLSVFHDTFVKAPLDFDGRMRCSFNPAGTETFRWSSSKNAFGRGTNLQNIPKGTEDE